MGGTSDVFSSMDRTRLIGGKSSPDSATDDDVPGASFAKYRAGSCSKLERQPSQHRKTGFLSTSTLGGTPIDPKAWSVTGQRRCFSASARSFGDNLASAASTSSDFCWSAGVSGTARVGSISEGFPASCICESMRKFPWVATNSPAATPLAMTISSPQECER